MSSNATISNGTILSYLKEFTVSTVRSSIEGLPLITETYQRTKGVLKTKYGKTSEIMARHV